MTDLATTHTEVLDSLKTVFHNLVGSYYDIDITENISVRRKNLQ